MRVQSAIWIMKTFTDVYPVDLKMRMLLRLFLHVMYGKQTWDKLLPADSAGKFPLETFHGKSPIDPLVGQDLRRRSTVAGHREGWI